jgi:nitrate reductase delta subunit
METTMIGYELFARLLAYPTSDYANAALELAAESNDKHLSLFAAKTSTLSLEEFEELYTRTFDINPVSSLEIGWHLYGETYERGSFLVKMRQVLKTLEIPESTELPDHLSHALLALEKLGGSKEAHELAIQYVAPALTKILEGFKDKQNPYEHVLLALQHCIEEHHSHGVERHE